MSWTPCALLSRLLSVAKFAPATRWLSPLRSALHSPAALQRWERRLNMIKLNKKHVYNGDWNHDDLFGSQRVPHECPNNHPCAHSGVPVGTLEFADSNKVLNGQGALQNTKSRFKSSQSNQHQPTFMITKSWPRTPIFWAPLSANTSSPNVYH